MDVVVRNLIPIRGEPEYVSDLLVSGLAERSYVLIVDHGIDESLFAVARRSSKEFFDLPQEQKLRSDIRRSANHRGFVPKTESGAYDDEGGLRRYEAFDVGRELDAQHHLVRAGTPLLGHNAWPDLDGFAEVTMLLYEKLAALSNRVLELIENGLGLRSGTFDAYRSEPISQMRYINYDARPKDAPQHVAMGAHTDYEFVTVLREWNHALEVLDSHDRWNAVAPPEGALVLLAGDLLEVVSGGRIRSAMHRVPDIAEARFSIPFFSGADYSAIVRPALPRVEGTELPEPIAAGPHLLRQLRRDFPYLRTKYQLDDDLDLTSPNEWRSRFENRPLSL